MCSPTSKKKQKWHCIKDTALCQDQPKNCKYSQPTMCWRQASVATGKDQQHFWPVVQLQEYEKFDKEFQMQE